MCAPSWCDLDLTFDLIYLMLFYLSTGISNTILSLLYLSYIFLLESWLLHLWVSFNLNLNLLLCRRNIFPEGELSALTNHI